MAHWAGSIPTPIGPMTAVVEDDGTLTRLNFADETDMLSRDPAIRWDAKAIADVARQIEEYFAGDRRVFQLPLRPAGRAFEQTVWSALLEIPYGQTVSYGAIARRIGQPGASRAVGRANNRNPIPIVIPCHRVIGADGSLVGYGGGLAIKTALLRLEGILPELLPF